MRQINISRFTGNAQIPLLYAQAFNTVDSLGSGTISLNALQRVISTSNLPASTIEQVHTVVYSDGVHELILSGRLLIWLAQGHASIGPNFTWRLHWLGL